MSSDYEKQRLARIEENERVLTGLGISAGVKSSEATRRAKEQAVRQAAQLRRNRVMAPPAKKAKSSRSSRRLKGEQPDSGALEEDKENVQRQQGESSAEEEEDEPQNLVDRWKALSSKEIEFDDSDGAADQRRRLFLVPTGIPGVNDHTLIEPVKQVDSYLWGFCEGLLSRIFVKIRPGDMLLMTSSGCGAFNRIARVKEKRVVSKKLADEFWSRMSFSMGGTSKSNVGFPLLVPVDKPIDINWDKMEVMRLLGYKDHLQSSRWIKDDKLLASNGQLVFKRCISTLNLPPTLTEQEKLQQQKDQQELEQP
mmetsp:Transcript_43158/g.69190  ORF Transcript_43158/g.69190 Transcript_43158/m.69190 type:complete len:310 (-) Transcript_43158:1763-2692(-)